MWLTLPLDAVSAKLIGHLDCTINCAHYAYLHMGTDVMKL